ncbi:TetR/AcrR family transcriptional regulator [Undibacterium sp. CY18W]|uniref:TetR/AcrR family transcriptional regulator n=1 Tax=Undibacterium hunanense TaxID=2762292 RepID=A0ABR6ZVL0_9BURK|nr:TetR/AcrR family transcriptional regulator [Undibacterium hunanense]MBC3919903.1 TetR/AcrR family transcriptional regulator [Undibacterium hunanense]
MSNPVRQTDRKREAILQAAIHEFRLHGFESTSMDKIAATAIVSKRTVYNHFPSKDDLFAAILLKLWKSAVSQDDFHYQGEKSLREQLETFLGNKMLLMCDTNFIDLARVAIAATIHTPDRARDMVERMNNREEGIVAWIRAAQADGKLKAGDAILMGDMLQGQLKSMAFWPQVAISQPVLDMAQQKQLIELTAGLFLGYYELVADAT